MGGPLFNVQVSLYNTKLMFFPLGLSMGQSVVGKGDWKLGACDREHAQICYGSLRVAARSVGVVRGRMTTG